MTKTEIKKGLLEKALADVGERIRLAREAMEAAQESANNETKSSAGDKYETGRAMAQIERDKFAQQLAEARKMQAFLEKINPEKQLAEVALGALVVTKTASYFVSVSMGRFELGGKGYFLVSPVAPIIKGMLGKQGGEAFSFNGKEVLIEEVF